MGCPLTAVGSDLKGGSLVCVIREANKNNKTGTETRKKEKQGTFEKHMNQVMGQTHSKLVSQVSQVKKSVRVLDLSPTGCNRARGKTS